MTKRAYQTSGLGNAQTVRRKTKEFDQKDWKFKRISFFQRNVRFAAAAKGFRLAYDVTQREVAEYFGASQSTVCCWESGKYAWRGGKEELQEYCDVVRRLAGNLR